MDFKFENSGERRKSTFRTEIYPRFVELWILLVIFTFFAVRVFGSGTWQHILSKLLQRHGG
jgi:hypothetical protein